MESLLQHLLHESHLVLQNHHQAYVEYNLVHPPLLLRASYVQVNDKLQTSNRSIFAVGDVCTEYHFTHVAGAFRPNIIST